MAKGSTTRQLIPALPRPAALAVAAAASIAASFAVVACRAPLASVSELPLASAGAFACILFVLFAHGLSRPLKIDVPSVAVAAAIALANFYGYLLVPYRSAADISLLRCALVLVGLATVSLAAVLAVQAFADRVSEKQRTPGNVDAQDACGTNVAVPNACPDNDGMRGADADGSGARAASADAADAGDAGDASGRSRFAAPAFKPLPIPLAVGVLIAAWAVYVVLCWPGSVTRDYFNQLVISAGIEPADNSHPYFMTMLYGAIYQVGHALAGASGGVALTVVFQVCVCVASASAIVHWTGRTTESRALQAVVLIFFAFMPHFPINAIVTMKDAVSAALMGLFFLQVLVRLWAARSGVRPAAFFMLPAIAAVAFLCALSRNNCIYVVVPTLIAMAVFSTPKRHAVFAAGAVAAAYLVWLSLILPAMGVLPGRPGEAFSIPMQQLSASIAHDADLTPEEEAVLDGLLDEDAWELGEQYTYSISDPVKKHFMLKDGSDVSALLSVWASVGARHPLTYVTAFLRGSVGYWYALLPHTELSYFNRVYDPIDRMYGKWAPSQGEAAQALAEFASCPPAFGDARWALDEAVDAASALPVSGALFNPALYVVLAVIVAYAGMRKKSLAIVFAVPLVLLFLVCCASPQNASARYALPLFWLLPIVIASTCVKRA